MSTLFCCTQLEANITGEDSTIVYVPKFREYGLPVHDGGNSFIKISYCPWCSAKLPGSLRNEWFDQLERRGIDSDSPNIPQEFLSDRWYLNLEQSEKTTE